MLMVVVMVKEVIMLMAVLKMVVEIMVMKDDIDFEDDDGVKSEFLQFNFISISTIFDANLSSPGSIRCK